MRTTVRLDPALMAQAKKEASRRGETLTSLIERGLRLVLTRHPNSRRKRQIDLPVSKATGGTLPGIDLDNSAELLDRLEEHE